MYFLDRGWNVVATVKHLEQETEPVTHTQLLVQKIDVTDTASIQKAFDAGVDMFGRIDVVVNNAGYGLLGPLELTTEGQVRSQFETNVFGVINVSRIAIPHFRNVGGGKIVNVSSMLGRITLPYMSMYVGTKFAVEGLSEDLYYELRDQNIQVKLIEPGSIRTNFFTTSLVRAESECVHVYNRHWHSVINNLIKRGAGGDEPKLAAQVIYKAATDDSTRLRYTVDKLAKLLIFLRMTTPLPLFQFIIRNTVK